jgi:hypothetical protein
MSCKIVGNLDLSGMGMYIYSISVNSSTDISKAGEELIQGPTIGTINIGGYAQLEIAKSETNGGTASVSINYVQKYDCDNDIVYLLFNGGGESNISGDVGNLATILESIDVDHKYIDASISNGPAQPYFEGITKIGYGLNYMGGPIPFATDSESVFSISTKDWGDIYLQNFSLNYTAGDIPTCSYSFMFSPNNNIVGLPKKD